MFDSKPSFKIVFWVAQLPYGQAGGTPLDALQRVEIRRGTKSGQATYLHPLRRDLPLVLLPILTREITRAANIKAVDTWEV